MKVHTLSILVDNKPSVLSRVIGLTTRRGYNIESLAVSPTHNPEYSRITMVVEDLDDVVKQICKQLGKLINVVSISDLTSSKPIERELMLMKINTKNSKTLAQKLKSSFITILSKDDDSITIQACATTKQLDNLEEALQDFDIAQIVRTGKIALP
ncbi:MAG: acetolactate synthase small subunit [Coriobacteriales bacterium]|nr:acetolactate synthase small subunit [Coriobacteriales bacterium]